MDNTVKIILIGVGAYVVYNWWASSQAAAAVPVAAPAPSPSTPVTTTVPVVTAPIATPAPVTTPAPVQAPPVTVTPPPPAAPAAASVQIVGPVTPNVNNSLTANVNINGTITNVTIIQSSGHAYDTSGKDVTATLTAAGVNVPALLKQMQAAYALANPTAAGVSGWFGIPTISRGMAERHGRALGGRIIHARPWTPGQNYVRPGSPMRRIA